MDYAIDLSDDNVPNIRFNACKTLETLCQYLTPEVIETKVKPVVNTLLFDKDRDVQNYARDAYDAWLKN